MLENVHGIFDNCKFNIDIRKWNIYRLNLGVLDIFVYIDNYIDFQEEKAIKNKLIESDQRSFKL